MIDWGDVPTWITTLAVGFGAVQLYQDRQARRRETEADARRQAQQVAVWAGVYVPGADGDEREKAYGVVLLNDSGLPVRRVEVEAMIHGVARRTLDLRILPPGEFFVAWKPNETWAFAVPVADYPHPIHPLTRTPKYLVTEMRLSDSAGRLWRYDADGRLDARDEERPVEIAADRRDR
jgi:hypothetical protein